MARKKPKRATNPTYEQRLILFIDFLGFKDIVDRTETSSEELTRIVQAIDTLTDMPLGLAAGEGRRVTQFSDCLVVSFPITARSAVFDLINSMAITIIQVVEMGYLLRGAVTVGKLLHDDQHLVGPAMNRAYAMETQEAVYPRVLIDPIVLRVARAARSTIHAEDEEERYVRAFIATDTDGRHYFDYVAWTSVVEVTGGSHEGYPRYLQRIGEMIEHGLSHKDVRVVKKYLWLHRHYTDAIAEFECIPIGHPFIAQSQDVYNEVMRLPRLSVEGKRARRRTSSFAVALAALRRFVKKVVKLLRGTNGVLSWLRPS
jgi:hypothetical protein